VPGSSEHFGQRFGRSGRAILHRARGWVRDAGPRARGIALALAAEALLVVLLLTVAPRNPAGDGRAERPLVTFDAAQRPAAEPSPERTPEPTRRPPAAERAPAQPTPPAEAAEQVPVPPPPAEAPPAPPPFILMPRGSLATTDLASAPRSAPARRGMKAGVAGPPNIGGGPPDTPRVEGSGPNGEPLYAAVWYREPYPEELRGYLSTARGPGWALIACRTAREWRVEACVPVAEYPEGSQIMRAVLAAAWQFKVRPPRKSGQYMVGEWVRIRIDYELLRK